MKNEVEDEKAEWYCDEADPSPAHHNRHHDRHDEDEAGRGHAEVTSERQQHRGGESEAHDEGDGAGPETAPVGSVLHGEREA